jgi:predicted lipoprotein with Yx(FWY)xxD motif
MKLALVMGAAVLLAGCGNTDTFKAESGPPPASPLGVPVPEVVKLQTLTDRLGTFLVDGARRSVYLFKGDTPNSGKSACTGGCATEWPPLSLTEAQVVTAFGRARQLLIGSLERSDGTIQVTYAGMPLYYYSKDTRARESQGQGLNQFGALWYLVQEDGTPLT